MRSSKFIIAALVIVSIFVTVYFFTQGSDSPKDAVNVDTAIPQYSAKVSNEKFLSKKLSDLDYWQKTSAKHVDFVLTDKPQDTIVAKRLNKAGEVVTSLSYSLKKIGSDTTQYTLYVNPEIYPASDPRELERQYTQLALIVLYQTNGAKDEAIPQKNMLWFLSDYRAHMDTNVIFSIHK